MYWAKVVVSSFMYFRMHVPEPVGKFYVFGCTKRLKHHSTIYSAMQKSVVDCAEKTMSSSRVEERKGPAPHLATSPALALLTTVRQLITFSGMLAR